MLYEVQEVLIEYIKENEEKLYKIAYTYTRDKDLALDVVQEAITKALENISKLKHVEYVKTWFYRILINEALKSIKNKKNLLEYEIDLNKMHTNSEDNLVDNLDIYNNIEKLNNKLKTVIVLRFFENLKIEEIAYITKTNSNTVKSRLYKGISEIKNNLKRSNI